MTQEEFFKRYSYDVDKDYIGGGGFGSVYKAYDNVLHRDVAIKVSEVKKAPNGKTFSLRDEIEALSGLPEHPNIANYEKEKLFTFKTPQGNFDYAVMQFYPDGNLTQAIKEGLTNEQKEEIATQLLEGIAFLHQHKVVHRDLKPGNILVAKHGGKVIPLITDFGLSKAADAGDGSMFSNSFGAGTPRYSSPEQLQGKPLRFNTDLWSYGAIVYELFTGEQLFSPGSGASNSAQAELEVYNKIIHGDVDKLSKMPERWRMVAERCMVVDPEKRVKSAEELMSLLKGYEKPTPVAEVSEPNTTPMQPQTQPIAEEETQLTPKPTPILVDPKPSENKTTEPPKEETPQKPKSKKALWIGLALAVVATLMLLVLLRGESPEEEEYKKCQTVNDYREYVSHYGTNGKYHQEAKKFIDDFVSDSLAKEKLEAERVEDAAFEKCVSIEACKSYLKSYPKGRYVKEVKSKKTELEKKEAEEKKNQEEEKKRQEEEKKKQEEEKKEDVAFENCTTIAACEQYLTDYPKGRYVVQVKAKKSELQQKQSVNAKPGFSVSSGKRVYFATGNLQYNANKKQWRIASNPWVIIGWDNKNISSTYNGWIDMFGWGTGNDPTKNSNNSNDYSSYSEWGNNVDGGWRTLTSVEWEYVFEKRVTPSGIRYAKAKVNGVNGVILLPDDWKSTAFIINKANEGNAPYDSNIISTSEWNTKFSPAGAAFLPVTGQRNASSSQIIGVGYFGYYWSATAGGGKSAPCLYFADDYFCASKHFYRIAGRAVRLVRPAN